jgi:hypothetical protein
VTPAHDCALQANRADMGRFLRRRLWNIVSDGCFLAKCRARTEHVWWCSWHYRKRIAEMPRLSGVLGGRS